MRTRLTALALVLGVSLVAQAVQDTPEAHVAVAKAAAGQEYTALFTTLCPATPAAAATAATPQRGGQPAAQGQRRGTPAVSSWHAEPVKVFDNLYFVGMTEYSAWAVVTSAGIIVIDTIYDYSVEDEV